MNKHSNFGYSTILLSFIIICILTFTALTLLTANSDFKLSKKVADRNSSYYEAQEQAYDELSDIDQLLLQCYEASSDEEAYYEAALTTITARFEGTFDTKEGQMLFSFSKSITSDQYLEVSLLLKYPENEIDTFYEIEKWQSIHIDTPFEEQPLNLIGGDN